MWVSFALWMDFIMQEWLYEAFQIYFFSASYFEDPILPASKQVFFIFCHLIYLKECTWTRVFFHQLR